MLAAIFTQSLETGTLPLAWKTAFDSPIFKKGATCQAENYRPVSLTCVTCKMLEHIIYHHERSHLDRHCILSPLQHGFRSGHSCETQLLTTMYPANQITSLQRPWKVLLSFCKRCVKTSWGRQCVEFSLRPQNDLKKRCAGTLTGRSGDVGLLWWRPGNIARKFCFHKNFPGTLSESFVSNRIVCLCSVNVV